MNWDTLNYTRSRDVERKTEENLNACLRSAEVQRRLFWMSDALANRGLGMTPTAYWRRSEAIVKVKKRFKKLFDEIPSRDSAMK